MKFSLFTHWSWVTHIWVSKLTIIGSDNGLVTGPCQTISRTNFSKIFIKIYTFPFKKMPLIMSSAKWWPFCPGLNELMEALQYFWSWCNPIILNSLAPGKFEWNIRYLILQIISLIDGWGISCELALRWMSLHLTDDKSILVQVMAWCHQATSHYLSQCWPRSLSPYGVTRSQCVNDSCYCRMFGVRRCIHVSTGWVAESFPELPF